jgi:tRNA modification GTPase
MKLRNDSDTICATATAPGIGAIAGIRLSGSDSVKIASAIATFLPENLESHRVYYGWLTDPVSKNKIDEVTVLYFQAGRSFSGEDTIEIFCHGSPLITQSILFHLIKSGARAAEPGEFSYRAFMNNRIDLSQAEAIQQIISSENNKSYELSLRQLTGELSKQFSDIEENLIWVLSRLEANLDFAQEDIEFEKAELIYNKIKQSHSDVKQLLGSYSVGKVIKNGIRVVLFGRPNVGKSSLLNRFLNEERSIVSPTPGTTRDYIEARFNYKNINIDFIDTAGVHESTNEIETVGINKSFKLAASADVILYLTDNPALDLNFYASTPTPLLDVLNSELTIPVLTKADLQDSSVKNKYSGSVISVLNDTGITELLEKIYFKALPNEISSDATIMNSRHYEELKKAEFYLSIASQLSEEQQSPELIISEAQEALFCIMRILGKKFDDQITDKIFKDFCLGK